MNDQSKTCFPWSCTTIRSATFSRGLASGPTQCGTPAGRTTVRAGAVLAHANLSARQAKARGLLTSGTYGPRSSILSSSVDLTSFLESRLRARTDLLGSTLYNLTWKQRVTPSGLLIPALRASVRHTSGSDFIGWPTPTAQLANKGVRTLEGSLREAMRNHGPDLGSIAALTSWGTSSTDTFRKRGGDRSDELGNQELVKDVRGPARLTEHGKLLTGLDAGMSAGGQLSPAHPRWLMGIPTVWGYCGATVTLSSRRKLRNSFAWPWSTHRNNS